MAQDSDWSEDSGDMSNAVSVLARGARQPNKLHHPAWLGSLIPRRCSWTRRSSRGHRAVATFAANGSSSRVSHR